MTRPTPKAPEVLINTAPKQKDVIHEVRQYKVITPITGGGFEPRQPNKAFPVRGGTIRGQLRFWWRATRGGQFGGDLERLKRAEAELWGAAADDKKKLGASKVQLEVIIPDKDKGEPRDAYQRQVKKDEQGKERVSYKANGIPPYAGFPLNPTEGDREQDTDPPVVLWNVSFELRVSYPKQARNGVSTLFSDGYHQDIQAALWAWQTFGGVGGRTRRGFGSLELITLNGEDVRIDDIKREVESKIAHFVSLGRCPDGIPHISVTPSHKFTDRTWRDLISDYQRFRQARRLGTAKNRPGRSYWPEPEAIRELTNSRHSRHQPIEPSFVKFPRAQFGLPIIFHFKDSGDPKDTTLQGKSEQSSTERLASPLILRPLPYCKGKKSIALLLETNGPIAPLEKLVLKDAPKKDECKHVEYQLDGAEARAIKPLNGQTNVLQAFLVSL